MFKKNKKKILKSEPKQKKSTFSKLADGEVEALKNIKSGKTEMEKQSADKFLKELKELENVKKVEQEQPVSDNCKCCEAGCTCCDHQSGTVGHRCVCRCHA